MTTFVPEFIARQRRSGRRVGRFQAAVLCVDLAGFVALGEALMQGAGGRPDGAERLSEVLASIFAPAVEAVYAHGGWISTFPGDAFTALFPGRPWVARARAWAAARVLQRQLAEMPKISTPHGEFPLSIRLGLAYGPVTWQIFAQGGRWAYCVRGAAVRASLGAQAQARPGEILCAGRWVPRMGRVAVAGAARAVPLAEQALFVPERVLGASGLAEFREIVPVFVRLAEVRARRLAQGVEALMRLAALYGGSLIQVDFDERGGVCVLLFGAPVAHENDTVRAAAFLNALTSANIPDTAGDAVAGVPWQAGATVGVAYVGLRGGVARSEYSAIGAVVNLAARLVRQAEPGEVWVSAPLAEALRATYQVVALGPQVVKGVREAVAVYRLAGPGELEVGNLQWVYRQPMQGRVQELQEMRAALAPLAQGRNAGVVYVHGEAGSGKSRLIHAVHEEQAQARACLWLLGQTDEILRQWLNPFKNMLRAQWGISLQNSESENKRYFDAALDALEAQSAARAPELVRELQDSRAFLGALLDLTWAGSLYELTEPSSRIRNIMVALRTWLKAESLRAPVIVVLEDVHWLDEDSRQCVQVLTEEMDAYPVALVCTARYRDDGTRVSVPVAAGVAVHEINLQALAGAELAELSRATLGGRPLTEAALAWVQDKTEGNPFFAEQMLLYLREHHFLEEVAGRWELKAALHATPASIRVVLIARLDRLHAPVKEVVQTAAVLGWEFAVPVLLHMLEESEHLAQMVEWAERERIWQALDAVRYLFHHALLRDAAYEMQTRARLRQLHAQAALAIAAVYADALEPHCASLARHYHLAEMPEQERLYARRAGEYAATRFANREALAAFSQALALTGADEHAEQYALLTLRQKVYDDMGLRSEQAADLEHLDALAEHMQDDQGRVAVALGLAHYFTTTSEYAAAILAAARALELAEQHGWRAEAAHALLRKGRALMQQVAYREAIMQLERALDLAHEMDAFLLEIEILRNLGNCEGFLRNRARAQAYYTRSLALARKHDILRAQLMIDLNVVWLVMLHGEYAESRHWLHAAWQKIAKVSGVFSNAIVLHIAGQLQFFCGTHAEAYATFAEAVRVCAESKNSWIGNASLCYLARLAHYRGDAAAALGYVERVLEDAAQRGAGGRHPRAHALLCRGFLWEAQGAWAAADACYAEAEALRWELDEPHYASEACAGRARVALARGDTALVRELGAQLYDYVTRVGVWDGPDDPFSVYLACYRALAASGDARAAEVLAEGYAQLMRRAAQFTDAEERAVYLRALPAQRELRAAVEGGRGRSQG